MSKVDDIEIDMGLGLVRCKVGTEDVTVDLLRPHAKHLLALVREMAADLSTRVHTGGEDNCADCVGECCTGWAMPITEADVARLAKGLGITDKQVKERHVDSYSDAQGLTPYQLRHVADKRFNAGQRCKFLGVTVNKDGIAVGRCTIYEHRPQVCRDYPAHNCDKWIPATALLRRLREARVDKR